jgi:hypothetical protein
LLVLQEAVKFKFPYKEAQRVALDYRDEDIQTVLYAARDAHHFLQVYIYEYAEIKKERDILAAENRMLKEMQSK